MILTNLTPTFNKNIFFENHSLSYLNHYLQKEYYDSISSIDLDSIECPYCHDHGFSFHAYYIRHIYIFGKKYKIIITRIICKHCHRTHAILIEDIIPYSQIRFEDILYMIKNREANCFDISHLFYILKKYMTLSSAAYKNICLKNRRKHACIFIVST